jgi:putative ABC transport system substrate-binding protein
MSGMKRREFITLLGGAAAAWPLAARGQQADRVPKVGVLFGIHQNDPEAQGRVGAFRQALQELGWIEGRNVRIDVRYSGGDAERARASAAELLTLMPDVMLAHSSLTLGPLRRATQTVPIVFVQVLDPVGAGFVPSLARPGGNITGFTSFEYEMSSKWLELLKEIAPRIARAAVLTHSAFAAGPGQLRVLQSVAPSLGVQIDPVDVQHAAEIERALDEIVRQANVGMIVTTSAFATVHRELIVALAARHRLPAVYPYRFYATSGGLASYGIDSDDLYRRAAGYVDRILKGAKPADLPVQQPTKFELVINLKTAKVLGLEIPATLLATADAVIE